MINLKKSAFTLVELIVVIVILAILATIAFLSFSSQSASARDSTRLADLNNIAKGLGVFQAVSGKVPLPDGPSIAITASGINIGYQGYAGANVLNMIKISNGGKDPLDTSTYYTYSTNSAQNKFQVLGFLEDGSSSALSLSPDFAKSGLRSAFADPSSYSGRYVITKGDQLGILLSSGALVPVQTQFVAGSFTGVDIVKSTTPYVLKLNNSSAISGTGQVLFQMNISSSCKRIKDMNPDSKDGIYTINPQGVPLQTYCDMTNDGGGWTLIGRSGNACTNLTNFGFTKNTSTDPSDIKECYSINILNLNFGQVMFGTTNDTKAFSINYGAVFNTTKSQIATAAETNETSTDFGVIYKGIGACKNSEGIGHWYLGHQGTLNSIGHKLGCGWSGCGTNTWGYNGIDARYNESSLTTLFESCGSLPSLNSYSVWVR